MSDKKIPHPNNPRQRVVSVTELVDANNPQRDGTAFPDDPTLTRMANLVRYMRRNEMYLPPNPWPEGMMLYGVDAEGEMCCAFMMLLEQFEAIPKEVLFGLCNPKTVRLYFSPVITMPPSNEAAQETIKAWLARTSLEDLQKMTLYLEVNRWYVNKEDR